MPSLSPTQLQHESGMRIQIAGMYTSVVGVSPQSIMDLLGRRGFNQLLYVLCLKKR